MGRNPYGVAPQPLSGSPASAAFFLLSRTYKLEDFVLDKAGVGVGLHWRRSFRPEPIVPEGQRTGFVPAMVVAETASAMPTAPARGRMVIMVGRDRRVIVDAGVDATALARVLEVLERR